MFERSVEQDLREGASLVALAVADELELRGDALAVDEIRQSLHGFMQTSPSTQSISVVTFDGRSPSLYASTSSTERPQSLTAGAEAIRTQRPAQ